MTSKIFNCSQCLYKTDKKYNFNRHMMSKHNNIANNNIVIDNLLLKTKPIIQSPTAYFFYNFAYPTFKSSKVLIIN